MTRHLWQAAGVLCVGLGIVGLILPFMPGMVFLLLAAFCFARSKPEWEDRLMTHPHVGPPLRDWRERRAISRKSKRSAMIGLAVCAVLAVILTGLPLGLLPVGSMALVAWWIWTRRE